MKVELAIFAPEFAPSLGLDHDAAQGALELVKEVVAKTWLPLVVPQRCGFQFLVGFRMADDVHGACCGYPEQLAPLGGN